jgi:hypothetical protein
MRHSILSGVMMSVVVFSVIKLNAIMQIAIMLNIIILLIIMLSVNILSVIMSIMLSEAPYISMLNCRIFIAMLIVVMSNHSYVRRSYVKARTIGAFPGKLFYSIFIII